MKHIYLTALFVLCAISINAQAQEYHPFVEDGKTWICYDYEYENSMLRDSTTYRYECFKIEGDNS